MSIPNTKHFDRIHALYKRGVPVAEIARLTRHADGTPYSRQSIYLTLSRKSGPGREAGIGGRVKSARKAAASRKNAQLGGRKRQKNPSPNALYMRKWREKKKGKK